MQHYNDGRVKPGDRPVYIKAVQAEMAGNDCIMEWMKQNVIRHNWILDEKQQKSGIDIQMVLDKKLVNIDIKYQLYNNPTSYVHEISQWNGTNWLDDSLADYLLWCITPLNIGYLITMDSIRNINTQEYKTIRTKETNASFCMVPIAKVNVAKIFDIDFSNMSQYFKQNKF